MKICIIIMCIQLVTFTFNVQVNVILRQVEIVYVPFVNPDGYEVSLLIYEFCLTL